MRIVSGRFRSRRLFEPRSHNIRPTTDRVRESLFAILEHRYPGCLEDACVLDLFAGTGALGMEALSRGALSVVFVERNSEALAVLRKNAEALAITGKVEIIKRDATRLGACPFSTPFDLVFVDPPYSAKLGEKALTELSGHGWLEKDALIVVEESKSSPVGTADGFVLLERRTVGATSISFLRHTVT